MFVLIITLVVSLHHKPVERHFRVSYPTRFTCEHGQKMVELRFRKAQTECVEVNNRI